MDVDRRIALAREWDDLVEQVRRMDGGEDFLRPPRLETLLPAAKDGPIVVLTVSRWRCDALVVTIDGVEVVALPGLTYESVMARVKAYLDGVDLDRCLRWMWDGFAGAILERLGYHGPPPAGAAWPRVWWCPTGPLALLPIHAAGRHHIAGAAVLDRVVSSYTPTVRALLAARAGGRTDELPDAVPGRMLFVGLDLPDVDDEERAVRELLPDGGHQFLRGARATRSAVLAELGTHSWVHFGCQSEQNLRDPARSGVQLCDGIATVTDLGARANRGEFGYLSGCTTTVALSDEPITLAAALHLTGYRHVIAAPRAAQVARDVYAGMVHDGRLDAGRAAVALHRVVRRIRARHPGSPGRWTPFAHLGP
jgi:hypothetical protein